jgi:Tetratricopeptide repeat
MLGTGAVLGPDHPDTLGTRGNLAYLLGEAGQVQEAIGQYQPPLEDYTRVPGPDHPATRTARNNLAYWREMLNHRRSS